MHNIVISFSHFIHNISRRLTYVEYPTLDEFKKIIDFEETSITDKRDKAILAFLYISCARVSAVATATINLVDLNKMIFKQDPLEGVKTKRQKYILTKLMPFDEKYFDILKNWITYLKQKQSFEETDPLFPKIKSYNNIENVKKILWMEKVSIIKCLKKDALMRVVKNIILMHSDILVFTKH